MALLKRKDFAAACGMAPKDLEVYISRKKVVLTKGKVDDSRSENIDFMESRKTKITVLQKKVEKEVTNPKEAIERAKTIDKIHNLSIKKKELENDKLDQEAELFKLKRQKLQGYLIPTELVKQLFAQSNKSIVITFQQAAEEIILEISKKKSP